jgi:hypothetical protein
MQSKVNNPNLVCKEELYNSGLIDKLVAFYNISGLAQTRGLLQINSAYRSGDSGAHGDGKALDIQVPTGSQRVFYNAAKNAGFKRFGFMSNTGLHIDLRTPNPPEA